MQGNILLSGRCNRNCYYCFGQLLPVELDTLNTLWNDPLPGIDKFINTCHESGVNEILLTGTNTDPLLYKKIPQLRTYLSDAIPDLKFGIQTNGVAAMKVPDGVCSQFDFLRLHIDSFDPEINTHMMGGIAPEINATLHRFMYANRKEVDIVLGPANVKFGDLFQTLTRLRDLGTIDQVNLMEPFGQPYIGDPMKGSCRMVIDYETADATVYDWKGITVVYHGYSSQLEHVILYPDGEVDVSTIRERLDHTFSFNSLEHTRLREQWIRTPQNPA